MDYIRRQYSPAKLLLLLAVVLVGVVSIVKVSHATGVISKSDLAGSWQATLVGDSGCGAGTTLVNFVLNSSGTGTATLVGRSAGCGHTTATGQAITITSLNTNGSGTLTLGCGTNCGFGFHIQVAPDRSIFNMVDIDNGTAGLLEGTAVHQTP